jgi:hypothetical protein
MLSFSKNRESLFIGDASVSSTICTGAALLGVTRVGPQIGYPLFRTHDKPYNRSAAKYAPGGCPRDFLNMVMKAVTES